MWEVAIQEAEPFSRTSNDILDDVKTKNKNKQKNPETNKKKSTEVNKTKLYWLDLHNKTPGWTQCKMSY